MYNLDKMVLNSIKLFRGYSKSQKYLSVFYLSPIQIWFNKNVMNGDLNIINNLNSISCIYIYHKNIM